MKKYLILLFGASVMIAGCEKKVEPIDAYDVTVEYKGTGTKFLTGDVTLNPNDSIYLDFTIASPVDMAYVEIQRNGVKVDTFRLNNAANKKVFSMIKGYRVDSSAGDYTYRVLGRDDRATFLGDGGKVFKVTVLPDFDFWSYRIMKVPDTTNKTNQAFYSVVDGKTYSYTTGGASSASIDFGYYFDISGSNAHCFYALNSAQPQLSFYDFTSWTKNATLLKKMPSSVNFVTNLRSSGAINTLIKGNMTSGTASKVTAVSTTAGSNVIGFKTASGKYGAILVRYTNQNSAAQETAIEIDVKVQK
jgi:hypothetical protein